MTTSRTDENPLYIRDILYNISQFITVEDLVHVKMANKTLHNIFHPDMLRQQLQYFSIKQIVPYSEHKNIYLFLDTLGNVWEGYLNKKTKEYFIHQLKKLPKIKSISRTCRGVIFLSRGGQVWVYGMNLLDDLGSVDSSKEPIRLAHLPVITQVATRNGGSFFLDKAGTVWYCGSNDVFPLGKNATIKIPTRIIFLPPIQKVVPALDRILFLDHKGEVWESIRKMSTDDNRVSCMPNKIVGTTNIRDIINTGPWIYFINQDGEVLQYNYTIKRIEFNHAGLEIVRHYYVDQTPTLTNIEYITRTHDVVFYVTTNKQVYIKGQMILDEKNEINSEIPTVFDEFALAKHILMPDYPFNIVVVCIKQTGEAVFCPMRESESYTNLLQLSKGPSFNFIDNGCIDSRIALFTKNGGNIEIFDCRKTSTYTRVPFNLAIQFHLDVIYRNSLEMQHLVAYACLPGHENRIYFEACMNVLRSESNTIRLFYLMQLQQSPWFNRDECADVLFYPHYSYKHHFDFDKEVTLLLHLKAIMRFYEYFDKKSVKSDKIAYQLRLQNFINLMNKVNNNEINNIHELKYFILVYKTQFTKIKISLFSYHLTFERPSHEYADLQNKLLTSLGADEKRFAEMKEALLFTRTIIIAYTGDHATMKQMQVQLQTPNPALKKEGTYYKPQQ